MTKTGTVAATAGQGCLLRAKWDAKRKVEMTKVESEGEKMKMLSLGVALVLAAVLVVGAALAVEGRLGTRSVPRPGHDPKSSADFGHVPASRAQGLMPEVTVTAEMPRLVMPTVEVRGFRTVAMSGSDLRAN